MFTSKKRIFGFLVACLLALFMLYARFYPTETFTLTSEGMTPYRNDDLAQKHTPIIYSSVEYGYPSKILYRAAQDTTGNTYIAYHIFWEGESNPHSGLLPALNRWLYTGGLKLQRVMFGPKDIEVIEVKLNPSGDVVRLQYETAKAYDPKGFSVAHQWVVREGDALNENVVFQVISWNHLFDAVPEGNIDASLYTRASLYASYFTQVDWEHYEMFKPTNTKLKKNRAHFDYERLSAEAEGL